jgi:hypothetical protein
MNPFRGYHTSPYDSYKMNIGKPWKVKERLRHLVSQSHNDTHPKASSPHRAVTLFTDSCMESQTFRRTLPPHHVEKGWILVSSPADNNILYSRHSVQLCQEVTMQKVPTIQTANPAEYHNNNNSVAQIARYYVESRLLAWHNSIFWVPHIPVKNICTLTEVFLNLTEVFLTLLRFFCAFFSVVRQMTG